MPPMAPEVGIIRTYIDWIVELPWANTTPDNLDVKNAAKVLERDHYGLKKAKERILEYIAVRSLKPKKERQPILCFVGPPGVGKTSLGTFDCRSIGTQVRARLAGRRARRSGDPRSSPHLYRRAARPHPPDDEARRDEPIRCSCWMRSTSCIPISAATRPRRCWKCLTPNRTMPSAIIISSCRSIFRRSCS